jgi:two-component system OmpR family sensor kinase
VGPLSIRVPLIAAIVLAVSLAVAAWLAFALILVTGRDNLDAAMAREQGRVERSLPLLIEEAGGDRDSAPDPQTLRPAAERYFRINPGTDLYITIIRIGDTVVTADDGPDMAEELRERGAIPEDLVPGRHTFDTPLGEIVSRVAALPVAEGHASVQIVAPTEPVRAEAFRALRWLGVASIVSLLVAGGLLALVLRRALRPLKALAATAGRAELEDLGLRVPEPERMDEVGVLTREFNRMLDRLEEAAEGQREFMATVSHELRTPVTIASGHIEVLGTLGDSSPEERARTVALVRDELIRMQRLVEDLMAVARSKAEGFIVKRPMRLPAFFDDLRLRLTGLGLGTRRIDVGVAPDLTFEADQERLAQAVLNLVVNADVHAPANTPIEVGARVEGNDLALFVRDEGPGIDPAIRDTMFEPFVVGNGAGGSTGLGLAVVAAVVEAHAGEVEVESHPGATTFTLRLPTGAGM